jgi:hypothetical protein
MSSAAPTVSDLPAAVQSCLRERGVSAETPLTPLKEGGNNQVSRIPGPKHDFVLKRYFQHPGDNRDRFTTEQRFYGFLWNCGFRQVSEPCAWDAENRVGLFSFVQGRKLNTGEVTRAMVDQALEFAIGMNQFRERSVAREVPVASEAYFSVPEQIAGIGRRVEQAQQIESTTETDAKAAALVRDGLAPAWQKIAAAIAQRCKAEPSLNQPLPENRRCLSPSDFGFHNALLAGDGRLIFFDFEYAGWDDPAKLICDFFCQPQVPVPFEFWDLFVNTLATGLNEGPELAERARILLPAYQIKWCCIMLNHFARAGRARREFARGSASEADKAAQLEKVRQALSNLRG